MTFGPCIIKDVNSGLNIVSGCGASEDTVWPLFSPEGFVFVSKGSVFSSFWITCDDSISVSSPFLIDSTILSSIDEVEEGKRLFSCFFSSFVF